MPGEHGALHPRGKLPHACEHGEFAQTSLGAGVAIDQDAVHLREQGQRLVHTLALDRFGQQRGRRGGNRAPLAGEGHVLDATRAVHKQFEFKAVAAQRVVTLRAAVGLRQMAEVPGPAVVVEDHLLVEVAQVGKGVVGWAVRHGSWTPCLSGKHHLRLAHRAH